MQWEWNCPAWYALHVVIENADWTQLLTITEPDHIECPNRGCGFRVRFNFWNSKGTNPDFQKGPEASERGQYSLPGYCPKFNTEQCLPDGNRTNKKEERFLNRMIRR